MCVCVGGGGGGGGVHIWLQLKNLIKFIIAFVASHRCNVNSVRISPQHTNERYFLSIKVFAKPPISLIEHS